MNLSQIENVFFIGIGGIGMSALARYFKTLGKNVSGYDKTPTLLTQELILQKIDVIFDDDINKVAENYLSKQNTLIVYTPAIPKESALLQFFVNQKFSIKKRAEVLGVITKDTFCFAIAGTHGKTTTSSILGHILVSANLDVTAFLGGIVEKYESNILGNGKSISVVEADEFDRSFLQLHPDMACITSIDADHLDIYGDDTAIKNTFFEFASKIKVKNNLFFPKEIPFEGVTLSINSNADFQIVNYRIEETNYIFDIKTPDNCIKNIVFKLPGNHNLMNALTAFAMAYSYGVNPEVIVNALATFPGIKRRFSFQIKTHKLVYIDDYAHHPTEIDAVYQAVKELYPHLKNIAIFQPHLFSRTKDFADDFAASLSQFDEIWLLDIYPARELPIEGVNSEWLLSKIKNQNKKIVTKKGVFEELRNCNAQVFITIGAGDIGEMVNQFKEVIYEKVV